MQQRALIVSLWLLSGVCIGKDSTQQLGLDFGARWPFFSQLHNFDKFYGQPLFVLNGAVDWLFLRWGALSLGGGVDISAYRRTGKQHVKQSDGSLQKHDDGLRFSFISYRFSPVLQLDIIEDLSVGVRFGYEELYSEELRLHGEKELEDGVVNKSWFHGLAIRASVNYLLNRWDEKSMISLSTMGIDRVYLSPFFDLVYKLPGNLVFGRDASKLDFSGMSFGLNIRFNGDL